MSGYAIRGDGGGWRAVDGPEDVLPDETYSTVQPALAVDRAALMRAERDRLLATNVDAINAVRWAAMSEPDRAAWTAYRQALLDVPQQAGFPLEVEWPVVPA